MRLTGNIPKLSIVVPVFNVEKYIQECLDSILHQSFQEFELLLIDDGSSDQSGSICDEYAAHDVRISVFHTINRGQAAARNLGIEKSKGEYIGFVDSDDWIDPVMFEKLLEENHRTECEIVACNFHIMDENGTFSLWNQKSRNLLFSKEEAMKEIIHNAILTFSPCNKIYKRSLFREAKFKEGIILEDMDLSYRILYASNGVAYISKGYYYYRYNEKSTLRTKFSLKRLDSYHVFKTMYEFYVKHYPEEALFVYYNLVMNGITLYENIISNHFNNTDSYASLISVDRKLLRNMLCQNRYSDSLKKKIKILMTLISPKITVRTELALSMMNKIRIGILAKTLGVYKKARKLLSR